MSRTIKLNSINNLEYQKQIEQLSKYLTEVEEKLLIKGFNLALLDKWKDSFEHNEISYIDINKLRGTGDHNIDMIVEIIYVLLYVKKKNC